MFNTTEVEVEIVGGLGNQLFGYAAGLFLSQKIGAQLKLNLTMVGVGGTHHGKSLQGFSIPSELFVDRATFRDSHGFLTRVSNKLARHSNLYMNLRNNLFGEYSATKLGFEENFWHLNKARKIKGYFQSYKYSDCVKDILRKQLVIPNPSSWYLTQLELIEKQDPIAIHIRRGDYLNLIDDFGVLDISYYESIIKENVPDAKHRKIWIFTDSPEIVAQEIIGTKLEKSIVVKSPQDSTVNEEMLLMSNFRTLIISNSTFSWWAAYLNKKSSDIHAPLEWFKGREAPEELFPPEWVLHECIWR